MKTTNSTTCHRKTAYNAKQTAKALRLLLRLTALLPAKPTTTRTNPRNPLRFALLQSSTTDPYRETVAFSAHFCSVCCSVSARLHCKLLNKRHKPKPNCSVCVRFLLTFTTENLPTTTNAQKGTPAPWEAVAAPFEGVSKRDPLATKGGYKLTPP